MKRAVLAYIPVLHAGYIAFLRKHPDDLFIIGKTIVQELANDEPYYGRDIRAVDPELMRVALKPLISAGIEVLELKDVKGVNETYDSFVAPDEDISREVIKRYFGDKKVEYDPVFLRWDKSQTEREFDMEPDREMSSREFSQELIALALDEAGKSSDWWRQVGCVVFRDDKVFYAGHNKHLPSPHTPYVFGDPKNNYDVGRGPGYYSSIHAEANVIAKAAKEGKSLQGASMYVTTFPCPMCAKIIAWTGIKKLYYSEGHSYFDARPILRQFEVKVIKVK